MAELYDLESNTLINNPNNRAVNSTDIQSIYEKVITIGMEDETIKRVSKNGQLYYEIKEPIIYKNPVNEVRGKLVLAEIDRQYRLFIVRADKKAVAVPFGEFISQEGKSVFDYIIKNEKIGNKTFKHIHFRSDEKSHYMTKNEMKKLTKYYSVFNNSQKVGEAILKYLKEGDQTLNQVADIWSGSGENKYNFCQEIRAHAHLLLNTEQAAKFLKFGNFIKYQYEKEKQNFMEALANSFKLKFPDFSLIKKNIDKFLNNIKTFDEKHYNSAGMADMSREDKGKSEKIIMDLFWGENSDEVKQKILDIFDKSEEHKTNPGRSR